MVPSLSRSSGWRCQAQRRPSQRFTVAGGRRSRASHKAARRGAYMSIRIFAWAGMRHDAPSKREAISRIARGTWRALRLDGEVRLALAPTGQSDRRAAWRFLRFSCCWVALPHCASCPSSPRLLEGESSSASSRGQVQTADQPLTAPSSPSPEVSAQ